MSVKCVNAGLSCRPRNCFLGQLSQRIILVFVLVEMTKFTGLKIFSQFILGQLNRETSTSTETSVSLTESIGVTSSSAVSSQNSVPVDFRCAVCLDYYKDPRHLPCGHTYCKGTWCFTPLPLDALIIKFFMEILVEEFDL